MKTKKLYAAKTIFLVMLSSFFSIAVSAQESLKHNIAIHNLGLDNLGSYLGAPIWKSVEVSGSTTLNKIDFAVLNDTYNIILNNVTIDLAEGCPLTIGGFKTFVDWHGRIIEDNGAVITLTLKGNNVLKTKRGNPAIRVLPGATLIIDGDGTLTVESDEGAGILLDYRGVALIIRNTESYSYQPYVVSSFHEYAGSITVNSGTITATGSGEYAGIGSSSQIISYYHYNIGFQNVEVGGIEVLKNGFARIPGNHGHFGVTEEWVVSGADVPFTTSGGNIIINGGKIIAKQGNNCTKGDIVRAGNNPNGRIEINGGNATENTISPPPVDSAGKRLYRIKVLFKDAEKGVSLSEAYFKQIKYGVAGMKTGDNFWFREGEDYQPGEISINVKGVIYENDEYIRPITNDGHVTVTLSEPNDRIPVRFRLTGEAADKFEINATYGTIPIEDGYNVSFGGVVTFEIVGTYDDGTIPRQYTWKGTGLPDGQKQVLWDNNVMSLSALEPIDLVCTIARYPTGIAPIAASDVRVSLDGQNLSVTSPVAERVTVYSVAGALLHRLEKPAGEASFAVASTASAQVLIVRGSSGWARKIIVND